MPILFLPLLGFVVFIIAAGWGFNALSHRVGADVAIAIYFLVLAIASAIPIAWLRKRRRDAAQATGTTLVSRTFSGAGSSVVVDARDRGVTLSVDGRTQRYAIGDLREWSVFADSGGLQAAGVTIRTRDLANATWSVPLASADQARECVALLDELRNTGGVA